MSDIGKQMFIGGGIGAGVGFAGGAIYGGIHARGQIERLPLNQATIPAHDVPMYEDRVVGHDNYTNIDTHNPEFSGSNTSDVHAQYPLHNADGSVRMQHIPQQVVTGHGTPVVNMNSTAIREPSDVSHDVNVNTYNGVGVNSTTNVSYRTIGYYQNPSIKWETGVSTFGQVMAYGALGAVAGAAGGALIGIAAQKALS